MTMGPLAARLVGAVAGALLMLLGMIGVDATTDMAIATSEAVAVALVGWFSFAGYGLVHKTLDRGRDQ